MFCVECGKKVESGWKFCLHCGAKVVGYQDAAPAVQAAPVEAPVEEVVSKRWIPGKKYQVPAMYKRSAEWDKKARWVEEHSELKDCAAGGLSGFYNRCFTVLEDDTLVGFVYGHCKKYEGAENYKYNLYRVDPDGKATFLNAGSVGGIEQMYVKDGYACWTWNQEFKVKID